MADFQYGSFYDINTAVEIPDVGVIFDDAEAFTD